MSSDSENLIRKLLVKEPEKRLGKGPLGVQEIMSHAFFNNLKWDDIYNKRVKPPFIPKVTHPADTRNFDTEFTSITPALTPVQSGTFSFTTPKAQMMLMTQCRAVLSQAVQEEFRGFSSLGPTTVEMPPGSQSSFPNIRRETPNRSSFKTVLFPKVRTKIEERRRSRKQ